MIPDLFCFDKRKPRFHFSKPPERVILRNEQGVQRYEIFDKKPLCPAADGRAGPLRAIEGSVAPIPCLGSETNECPMSDQCFTLPFWSGLDDVINQYIDSVTLEQLAQSLSSANDGCCGCNSKN